MCVPAYCSVLTLELDNHEAEKVAIVSMSYVQHSFPDSFRKIFSVN